MIANYETLICGIIVNTIGELEDELRDILSGTIEDALGSHQISSPKDLTTLLSADLVDFGICAQPSESETITVELYKQMLERGLVEVTEELKAELPAVGAQVLAKYFEDEQWYDAVIDAIDDEGIWVTFTEYGNQEVVTMDDIQQPEPPPDESAAKPVAVDFQAETNLDELVEPIDPPTSALDVPVQAEDVERHSSTNAHTMEIAINAPADNSESESDSSSKKKRRKKGRRGKKGKRNKSNAKSKKGKGRSAKKSKKPKDDFIQTLKQTMQEEWFDLQYANREKTVDSRDFHFQWDLISHDEVSVIIQDIKLDFQEGRKYGLIGKNGVGKSTLLRRLGRYDCPSFPKWVRVMYVEQEIEGNEMTTLNTVIAMDVVLTELRDREKKYEKLVDDGDHEAAQLLADTYELRYSLDLDEESVTDRALEILRGLRFTDEMIYGPTSLLSGGWKMRVVLAGVLFVKPDILMLDEPTNHLDFPAVIWLQEYLKAYDSTVIVISHDRSFLNEVCDKIVFMQDGGLHGSLTYFDGNYEQYVAQREQAFHEAMEAYESQQRRMEGRDVRRFRISDAISGCGTAEGIKMLQIKGYMNVERELSPPKRDKSLVIRFPEVMDLLVDDQMICGGEHITFGYSPNAILMEDISFSFTAKSRVGIFGANGCGKSTLIKLILNHLEPISGRMKRSHDCRLACFFQHHMDQLELDKTPLQFIYDRFRKELIKIPRADETIRAKLSKFGIRGKMCLRPMSTFSGGQKSRVAFTVMMWKRPQFVIMDEPTNHLDMETIDALANAMTNWNGGLLIVSHDAHFLQTVCSEYWIMAKKKLNVFDNFRRARRFALKHAND